MNEYPRNPDGSKLLTYSRATGWGEADNFTDEFAEEMETATTFGADGFCYEIARHPRTRSMFVVWLDACERCEPVVVIGWPDLIELLRVLEPVRASMPLKTASRA